MSLDGREKAVAFDILNVRIFWPPKSICGKHYFLSAAKYRRLLIEI